MNARELVWSITYTTHIKKFAETVSSASREADMALKNFDERFSKEEKAQEGIDDSVEEKFHREQLSGLGEPDNWLQRFETPGCIISIEGGLNNPKVMEAMEAIKPLFKKDEARTFIKPSAANGMEEGTRVICVIDRREGYIYDITQDGDCRIEYDDGTIRAEKWNNFLPKFKRG